MPRVKFLRAKPEKFFEKIQNKTELTFQELADACKVHRRSFSDWKYGRYLMPLSVFEKIVEISNIDTPSIKTLPDYWYTREGGRKGGLAVYKKYGGIPGWTREASRRGGLKAIETHRRKGSKFFVCDPTLISIPKNSPQLAELVGILLGDGGLTRKQVTVSVNKFDDQDFIPYIAGLFQKLFSINPSIYITKKDNCAQIVLSRSKLVHFFVNMGLCIGSKVRHQVDVPSWIKKSEEFSKYCLRGLFDTDGCFYIDKHRYKNKIYLNCGMCFRNYSLPVLLFFKTKLEQLGLHPTHNTKFSICLRRENEIIKYFQIVGSSNLKHLNKFKQYFKNKHGGVPKFGHTGAVSKTDGR